MADYTMDSIRTFAVTGHGKCGKTSIADHILFKAGAVNRLGNVEEGTSVSDFTDEEKHLLKYDFHAGWWETAMMLKYFPELVDKSYKDLKPYLKNLITRKVITPEIKPQGYLGSPAKADPDFAEASMKVFARITAQLINRCLNGEDLTRETTSPYYKYPNFHPFFKRNLAAGIIAIIFLAMFTLLIKLLI